MNYDIKDVKLAKEGMLRVEWANQSMPVLNNIKKRFAKEKPLKGKRIAACLHVTTETASLMQTLKAGGARVALCASNPLSTQDDVAASLVRHNKISVFAIKGEDSKTYYQHIHSALDIKPHYTMDDGADLVSTIHSERPDLLKGVLGGTEETTTGIIRLRSMAADGVLQYPIISVNDARTKHFFDNRLRHRPEHYGRNNSGHKPPDRRIQFCGLWLWMVRPWPCPEGPRNGGKRYCNRSRSHRRS